MTISVRPANITDWQEIASLLRDFRKDPVTPPWFAGDGEMPKAEEFLVNILSKGYSWVALADDEMIGMIIAINVNVPFTSNLIIEEFFWYVSQEHRGSRAGLMLLGAWETMVKDLKERGAIIGGVLHTMRDSPVDLVKRGYVVSDTSYML